MPTPADFVPNYIALRTCAQAISGYADALVAEGRTNEAIAIYEKGLKLGHKLQGHRLLIQDVIGMTCEMVTHGGIVVSLSPDVKLSALQCRKIGTMYLDNLPDRDFLAHALGAEAQQGRAAFKMLEDETSSQMYQSGGFSALALLVPGMLEREKRVYFNRKAEMLKAERKGALGQLVTNSELSLGRYLSGEVGVISSMILPSMSRVSHSFAANRKLLLGTATAYLVRAHRLENSLDTSKAPGELDELLSGELTGEQIEELKTWNTTLVVEGRHFVLSINLTADESAKAVISDDIKWIRNTGTSLNFRI